eukprot:1156102-Amphidinium_carterae.1
MPSTPCHVQSVDQPTRAFAGIIPIAACAHNRKKPLECALYAQKLVQHGNMPNTPCQGKQDQSMSAITLLFCSVRIMDPSVQDSVSRHRTVADISDIVPRRVNTWSSM